MTDVLEHPYSKILNSEGKYTPLHGLLLSDRERSGWPGSNKLQTMIPIDIRCLLLLTVQSYPEPTAKSSLSHPAELP